MEYNPGPKIVIKPSFAVTMTDLKARFFGINWISKDSTVVLEGETYLNNMIIDGTYHLKNMKLKGIKL